MDEAISQVGLPVICGFSDCGIKGLMKPRSDYDGWYKSRFFRFKPKKRWFCPTHHEEGKAIDHRFYDRSKSTNPEPLDDTEEVVTKLYELLE